MRATFSPAQSRRTNYFSRPSGVVCVIDLDRRPAIDEACDELPMRPRRIVAEIRRHALLPVGRTRLTSWRRTSPASMAVTASKSCTLKRSTQVLSRFLGLDREDVDEGGDGAIE